MFRKGLKNTSMLFSDNNNDYTTKNNKEHLLTISFAEIKPENENVSRVTDWTYDDSSIGAFFIYGAADESLTDRVISLEEAETGEIIWYSPIRELPEDTLIFEGEDYRTTYISSAAINSKVLKGKTTNYIARVQGYNTLEVSFNVTFASDNSEKQSDLLNDSKEEKEEKRSNEGMQDLKDANKLKEKFHMDIDEKFRNGSIFKNEDMGKNEFASLGREEINNNILASEILSGNLSNNNREDLFVDEIDDIDDLTDLTDLSDLGDIGDISDISDLSDLGNIDELDDIPDIDDISDLGDIDDMADIPDLSDIDAISEIKELEKKIMKEEREEKIKENPHKENIIEEMRKARNIEEMRPRREKHDVHPYEDKFKEEVKVPKNDFALDFSQEEKVKEIEKVEEFIDTKNFVNQLTQKQTIVNEFLELAPVSITVNNTKNREVPRINDNIIIEKVGNYYITILNGLSFKPIFLLEGEKQYFEYKDGPAGFISKVKTLVCRMYGLEESEFNNLKKLLIIDEDVDIKMENLKIMSREASIELLESTKLNILELSENALFISLIDENNLKTTIRYRGNKINQNPQILSKVEKISEMYNDIKMLGYASIKNSSITSVAKLIIDNLK